LGILGTGEVGHSVAQWGNPSTIRLDQARLSPDRLQIQGTRKVFTDRSIQNRSIRAGQFRIFRERSRCDRPCQVSPV